MRGEPEYESSEEKNQASRLTALWKKVVPSSSLIQFKLFSIDGVSQCGHINNLVKVLL